MIPRRRFSGWGVRAAIASAGLAAFGIFAIWWMARAPGVGLPDGPIAPLFGPRASEAPSRDVKTASIFDSIRHVPASAKPVHMIMVYVHGISCHSPDYSAPFQFRLAKALGMARAAPAEVTVVELKRDGPISRTVPDYLSTDDFAPLESEGAPAQVKAAYSAMRAAKTIPSDFAPACSDPETGNLVRPLDDPRLSIRHFKRGATDKLSVIEVLWSPLSERQKLAKVGEDLNLDASSLRPAPLWPSGRTVPRADVEKRAFANQILKASVINGAIADAIFYLGDGGPDIRAAVMAGIARAIALRREAASGATHQVRMAIVAESLGSRIAFDTLREAPDRFAGEIDNAISLLKSQPRVIMFANQLPLLDIAARPDRTIVSGGKFDDLVAQHSARIRILQDAGDAEAGRDVYPFGSVADPPSWRACAQAFGFYARAATLLATIDPKVAGASAEQLADNMQFALTHPLSPILAMTGSGHAREDIAANLASAHAFAGSAMAFLAFSPGGEGYANCQKKLSLERDKVAAIYLARGAQGQAPVPEDIARAERLLKIADDVRASRIVDIDAISNSRASVVFALLYRELQFLAGRCAKSAAPPGLCDPATIKTRLTRVAGLVPRIEVLAFSDPNDLLSYRVTPEQYESETFAFTNVPIRLADPILPAAGRWGGFTPPMEAHTNHKFDSRILRMLVCGWDGADGACADAR
jgi:hypothetical protein